MKNTELKVVLLAIVLAYLITSFITMDFGLFGKGDILKRIVMAFAAIGSYVINKLIENDILL